MKAFCITEPERCAVIDIPEPQPGPGEILLKTRLIGLCGTDLSTFRGKNPLVSYPRVPGHEIAATIAETGRDVPPEYLVGLDVTAYPNTSCGACSSCKRGRTNACKFNETLGVQRDGAMKEFFTIPWQKAVPSTGLSLRELSLVEPLSVGFHAVERGRVMPGDTVAVIGCGMVGLGALAAAGSRGARTIGIDLDDGKLQLARQAGAQQTVHSHEQNVHAELERITGGFGPDVIIEAVGAPDTYRLAIEEASHCGRVVYIGWAKEPISFETKLFVHKELDILGSRNYLNEFAAVIEILKQRRFPVDAVISRTVALDEAAQALADWSSAPQAFTKILVDMNA